MVLAQTQTKTQSFTISLFQTVREKKRQIVGEVHSKVTKPNPNQNVMHLNGMNPTPKLFVEFMVVRRTLSHWGFW